MTIFKFDTRPSSPDPSGH